MTPIEIAAAINDEIISANERYGPFTSAHEGYGVLAEEVAELLSAIHSNKRESVRSEAIQVAAVAWRIALSMNHFPTSERSGMYD